MTLGVDATLVNEALDRMRGDLEDLRRIYRGAKAMSEARLRRLEQLERRIDQETKHIRNILGTYR